MGQVVPEKSSGQNVCENAGNAPLGVEPLWQSTPKIDMRNFIAHSYYPPSFIFVGQVVSKKNSGQKILEDKMEKKASTYSTVQRNSDKTNMGPSPDGGPIIIWGRRLSFFYVIFCLFDKIILELFCKILHSSSLHLKTDIKWLCHKYCKMQSLRPKNK